MNWNIDFKNFNDRFPQAFDITLGSNQIVWGIWFKLPNNSRNNFIPLSSVYGSSNHNFIEETEMFDELKNWLIPIDQNICLN